MSTLKRRYWTIWVAMFGLAAMQGTASAQNCVYTKFLFNSTAVGCSADGTKVFATSTLGANTKLYFSTNFGGSWQTNVLPTAKQCFNIAVLANGGILVVAEGGGVAVSTNFGTTWITNDIVVKGCYNIAGSADGTQLIAGGTSAIYLSTNSGLTWISNSLPMVNGYSWNVKSVASSATGHTLAVETDLDGLFISTNSGTTWTNNGDPVGSVWVSAEGTKMAVYPGIYVSTNAGVSWELNEAPNNANIQWTFAASVDGNIMAVLFDNSSEIDYSPNWTGSWIVNSPPPALYLQSLAISADGTRWCGAGNDNRPIGTLLFPPSLNVNASGGNLVISWPAPSVGWTLEVATDMSAQNWTNVPQGVVVANYQNHVTVPTPDSGNIFYRLAYQMAP